MHFSLAIQINVHCILQNDSCKKQMFCSYLLSTTSNIFSVTYANSNKITEAVCDLKHQSNIVHNKWPLSSPCPLDNDLLIFHIGSSNAN